MLSSTCSREAFLLALLGICLPSRWNPPFPLHALTLIFLFLAKVRLSHTLTLSSFMIWCFGQTALFLFFLARAAPAFLPTDFSVALRPLFPFRQAQYAQVSPLKPAPFCKLFTAAPTSLPFFFSPSPVLFSNLKLCGRSGRNCFPSLSVLLDYNGSLDTRFSRERRTR